MFSLDKNKKHPRPDLSRPGVNMRGGQLLIEMLVALGILTVGFLGVMSLLSRALSLNRVVADNYTATYLASEGVEVVKNILDGNAMQGKGWNAGFSDGDFEADFGSRGLTPSQGRYLTFDNSTHQYGYGFDKSTPYIRTISIKLGNADITVNSKVDWVSRGSGTFSVNIEDHFYNWR